MKTTVNSLWETTFPTLPKSILPDTLPQFTDAQGLIEYVRENIPVIEENWTTAIRQRGIQGRLRMMEDDKRDEEFRSETLRRAIVSAQNKLLNI